MFFKNHNESTAKTWSPSLFLVFHIGSTVWISIKGPTKDQKCRFKGFHFSWISPDPRWINSSNLIHCPCLTSWRETTVQIMILDPMIGKKKGTKLEWCKITWYPVNSNIHTSMVTAFLKFLDVHKESSAEIWTHRCYWSSEEDQQFGSWSRGHRTQKLISSSSCLFTSILRSMMNQWFRFDPLAVFDLMKWSNSSVHGLQSHN